MKPIKSVAIAVTLLPLYGCASLPSFSDLFHPEPTTADFITRATVYQRHGYFPVDELAAVSERIAAAAVTEPQRLLRRFVELAEPGV